MLYMLCLTQCFSSWYECHYHGLPAHRRGRKGKPGREGPNTSLTQTSKKPLSINGYESTSELYSAHSQEKKANHLCISTYKYNFELHCTPCQMMSVCVILEFHENLASFKNCETAPVGSCYHYHDVDNIASLMYICAGSSTSVHH